MDGTDGTTGDTTDDTGEAGDLDGLLARVGEWRDDEATATAARSRATRHWLLQQLAESTTLAGVLLTLAERQAPVSIRTAAGGRRGRITAVTTALCAMELDGGDGGRALFPVSAITAVDGGAEINDDRTPVATTDLVAALAMLAADRVAVTLHLSDGTAVAGTLAVVGADVVQVKTRSGAIHVPLRAVACCEVGAAGRPDYTGESDADLGSVVDLGSG